MPGPVLLIGMMGSGKTRVGRALAGLLQWEWLDLDEALELRFKRTVAEQFELDGEAVFRRREGELLRELGAPGSRVVSTGVGIVLDPENRVFLKKSLSVYLEASPKALAARLAGNQARKRPLLRGAGNDLEGFLRQMSADREALYRSCATLTVQAESASPHALARDIADRLGAVLTGPCEA